MKFWQLTASTSADLAQQLLEDASRMTAEKQGERSNRALLYGLWAGEKIELDKARSDLTRAPRTGEFYFGCETRRYIWAKSVDMVDQFVELFNYATITHYIYDTWYPVFEPYEGEHRWGINDEILEWRTALSAHRASSWYFPGRNLSSIVRLVTCARRSQAPERFP